MTASGARRAGTRDADRRRLVGRARRERPRGPPVLAGELLAAVRGRRRGCGIQGRPTRPSGPSRLVRRAHRETRAARRAEQIETIHSMAFHARRPGGSRQGGMPSWPDHVCLGPHSTPHPTGAAVGRAGPSLVSASRSTHGGTGRRGRRRPAGLRSSLRRAARGRRGTPTGPVAGQWRGGARSPG